MLPTVRDALAMPILATAEPEICAGEAQLDRPVRWLHPAEVADIADLLRGDEIVLTTGVFLPDDVQAARAYVESLVAAGVAGLILELGRRWANAPSMLVDACAEFDLAFVVLHREVRFSDVVEEIGARILDSEVEELRASEQIHETFTRLDVDGAGPAEILDAVVRLSGTPVVLESSRHQVIGYDAAGRASGAAILADWSRRSRAVRVSGRTGYDRRSGWLTTIVGSRGDDWGRLVLLTDQLPGRRDYLLIERAAVALTLHQLLARARDSVERSTHASLIAELRADRVNAELLTRLDALDFAVRGRRFVAVALRHDVESGERQWSLSDLASLVGTTLRSQNYPALVAIEPDHVVALVSCPKALTLDALMSGISRGLRRSAAVVLACGAMVERITEASATLMDARNVIATVVGLVEGDRHWVSLDDLHLRGLLSLLRDDERLVTYVRRELGALIEHDRARGSSLTLLLETYLDTPGGKSVAAKRLLLSRPVLYERIARIESILGVDLDDPHVRTSLHVACIARRLLDDDVTGEGR